MLWTISLNNARFFAAIGVHQSEHVLKNELLVSIDVQFTRSNNIDTLDDSIDYAALYNLVQLQLSKPCELLEFICQGVLEQIFEQWPQVQHANIRISKLNPAFAKQVEAVSVGLQKDRN